ncbi:hypothetical protein [Sulfurifustis variabilis]|nr:hypothetical protein [Sulfurifustis variabilis]
MTSEALLAWRRLFSAVLTLTCESGTVQQRLADAYLSNLEPLHGDPAALPEVIRTEFALVQAEVVGSESVLGHDFLRETIEHMDREQARRIAGRIVAMYDKLAREAA